LDRFRHKALGDSQTLELSIHIKTLLDDLNFFKDYCPRNLFSGSNFPPEKSLQKNRSIFCLENQSCDWRYVNVILIFLKTIYLYIKNDYKV